MRIAVITILIGWSLSSPASARCFSVWHYPYPQRCSFHVKQRVNTYQHLSPTSPSERIEPESGQVTNCTDFCVGWPEVTFEPCPMGDDRLKGVALLRALSDVPPTLQGGSHGPAAE